MRLSCPAMKCNERQWMTLERAKVELKNYITLAGSTIRKKKKRHIHLQNEWTEHGGNNLPEHLNGCDIQAPTLVPSHDIVLNICN